MRSRERPESKSDYNQGYDLKIFLTDIYIFSAESNRIF